MTTPEGLSPSAVRLWEDTTAAYDLETHELLTLEQACRELTLIDRMDSDIAALDDLVDEGSMGQRVVSELVKEVRQHRAEFSRQIKALGLPADGAAGARSDAARAAANARWHKDD